MLSVLLYGIRRDFNFHILIVIWLVLCLLSFKVRSYQTKFFILLGHFNSKILLSSFYLLFFTPFSVIYRLAFRNKSFTKTTTRFVVKNDISPFDRPF